MIKRFRPNKWKDCDGDWFSTGVEEHPDGRYVLYSDYMELEEEIVQRQDTEDSLTKWVDKIGSELDELKKAILQIKEYANGQNWRSIVNMIDKIIAKEDK